MVLEVGLGQHHGRTAWRPYFCGKLLQGVFCRSYSSGDVDGGNLPDLSLRDYPWCARRNRKGIQGDDAASVYPASYYRVASCLLPDAGKGIEFLLKPDFGKVDRNVFLNALGQSFYSMSIGMGCICTYASYFSRRTNLLKSAIQISAIDLMVAVLAGLMIFPAAFSVGISPDSGPSLIFITLPNVFNEAFASMPVLGWIISLMFYVLLSVAALTSLMSLHEVNTSFFYEELKIDRKKGAMIVTVSCAIIGAFCSLSLGATDKLSFYGKTLFDWFDFVTGQLFLPAAGLLTCLFLGWYVPKKVVQDEFTNWGTLKGKVFNVYLFLIKFVCPILIFLVFLNQFGVLG